MQQKRTVLISYAVLNCEAELQLCFRIHKKHGIYTSNNYHTAHPDTTNVERPSKRGYNQYYFERWAKEYLLSLIVTNIGRVDFCVTYNEKVHNFANVYLKSCLINSIREI